MQETEGVRQVVGEITIWVVVGIVFGAFLVKLRRLVPRFRGQETEVGAIIRAGAGRESDDPK